MLSARDGSGRGTCRLHARSEILTGPLLNDGVANDVWDRQSRGADLYRDQHHLRYRNAPSHQRSLVGIARDICGAVVGRKGAVGPALKDGQPSELAFELRGSRRVIAAKTHA